jgi:hypothetical protein
MIGQYLSQTNKSATVPVLQNFLELNKALGSDPFQGELMDVAYSIIFA